MLLQLTLTINVIWSLSAFPENLIGAFLWAGKTIFPSFCEISDMTLILSSLHGLHILETTDLSFETNVSFKCELISRELNLEADIISKYVYLVTYSACLKL